MKLTLEQLQTEFSLLNDIPFLNHGGCLFSAYSMFLYLTKKGYTNVRLIQYSSNDNDIKQNLKFLNNETDKAGSSHHFGLSLDEFIPAIEQNELFHFVDSETTYSVFFDDKLLVIPNDKVDVFSQNALINGKWNPTFDRKYLSEIEKILIVDITSFLTKKVVKYFFY